MASLFIPPAQGDEELEAITIVELLRGAKVNVARTKSTCHCWATGWVSHPYLLMMQSAV